MYVVLGLIDTKGSCPSVYPSGDGMLYEGLSYGLAASILSLCTNVFATLAVAFKAWYVFLRL